MNDNERLGAKRLPTGGNLVIITNSKVDTKHPNRFKLTERVII
jgi:hypothetical protein